MKYTIAENAELTIEELRRILNNFQTSELPKLKHLYNYYIGKQAIMYKEATDKGKSVAHVCVNFCKNTVDNYLGYMLGTPVTYAGENVEKILEVLNYNDIHAVDTEYLRQALIYGRAFHINFIDREGFQRLQVFDSRECIPVYANNIENDLEYVIRFYKDYNVKRNEEVFAVEVYSKNDIKFYSATPGFTVINYLRSVPHYFKQVPVTVFSLNTDEQSIFAQIMTLNDAYNSLISGEVDSWDAFADAYLMLKGVNADDSDLDAMKEHRCLILPNDADASYLTKNVSDTQVTDMLDNLNKKIHEIANSPEFNNSDFGTESGIAIQYKLLGFENTASAIEANLRKALQRRIELISTILALTNEEETWRDVIITFIRNLPVDLQATADIVAKLNGIVSRETLLSILPFVPDPKLEAEKVQKENDEEMSLYKEMNSDEEEENVNTTNRQ